MEDHLRNGGALIEVVRPAGVLPQRAAKHDENRKGGSDPSGTPFYPTCYLNSRTTRVGISGSGHPDPT